MRSDVSRYQAVTVTSTSTQSLVPAELNAKIILHKDMFTPH